MRRFWMALLAFLGLACIAAAITIPTYLVPKLKVVPLDLDITSDASTVAREGGAGERFPAVIFDRCSVTKPKAAQLNVNLRQQRRSIIVDPSNETQATLQSAQSVLIERVQGADGKETVPTVAAAGDERSCSDGLLTATIDRVSVNRKTSAPNGAVSSLQLEAQPEGTPLEDVSVQLDDRKGFQYKFGFGVQKTDYYYYDLNTRQDTVASFVDEKTIDGLKVYHFTTEVPETNLADLPNPQDEAPLGTILTMPAKWWGISGRGIKANEPITMQRYAAAVRHVYVEPTTGTIVDGFEEQHQYFKSPDDEESRAPIRDFRLDALKATFKWSDSTVSEQVQRADKYVGLLRWGGTLAPIILGVLGAILLALCALLFFRGRGRGDGDGDAPVDGAPAPTEGDGSAPDDDGGDTYAYAAVPAATAAAAWEAPAPDAQAWGAPAYEQAPAAPAYQQAPSYLADPPAYETGLPAYDPEATAALSADEYWAPEIPTASAPPIPPLPAFSEIPATAPAPQIDPLSDTTAFAPLTDADEFAPMPDPYAVRPRPDESPTTIVPVTDFVVDDTAYFQRPAAPQADPTAEHRGRHERPE